LIDGDEKFKARSFGCGEQLSIREPGEFGKSCGVAIVFVELAAKALVDACVENYAALMIGTRVPRKTG
jgi:hypothetical protein